MNPNDEEIDHLVRKLFEAGRPSDALREQTMERVDEAMLRRNLKTIRLITFEKHTEQQMDERDLFPSGSPNKKQK